MPEKTNKPLSSVIPDLIGNPDPRIREDDKLVVPVYGSANQIASDLKKMASESTSAHPRGEPSSTSAHPGGVDTIQKFSLPTGTSNSIKRVVILTIALLLTIGAYLYFQKGINPFQSTSLTINSLQDEQTNQKIENITGLGWNNISTQKTGSKEEKLTALLLLHEEESWIFQKYNSLVAGKYLLPQQLSSLKAVAEDPNKQNNKLLLENLTATTKVYGQIKVPEAQVHQNRLEVLKKYFAKYEVLETDQIPTEADTITLDSHPAENQKDLMKLLYERFNNWHSFIVNST